MAEATAIVEQWTAEGFFGKRAQRAWLEAESVRKGSKPNTPKRQQQQSQDKPAITDAAPTTVNRTLRRLPNAAYRQREYLTEKEVERLIEAARRRGRNSTRDSAAILLAYRHGLRQFCAILEGLTRRRAHQGNSISSHSVGPRHQSKSLLEDQWLTAILFSRNEVGQTRSCAFVVWPYHDRTYWPCPVMGRDGLPEAYVASTDKTAKWLRALFRQICFRKRVREWITAHAWLMVPDNGD